MKNTKTAILGAAEKIVLAGSFTNASVNDICEEAGVAKGGFFHYFPTKEDLAVELASFYWENVESGLRTAPFFRKIDPLERLRGYFDHYIGIAKDPSVKLACVLGNMAQELSSEDSTIRKACKNNFMKWASMIASDLDAAKDRYGARAPFDSRETAEYIVAVMEGSLLLARTHENRSIDKRNIEFLKDQIVGLFDGPIKGRIKKKHK